MKRIFTLALLAVYVFPVLALAAYNDVTLTSSTVLSVGGIEIDVTGTSAVIESITVNSSNFSVTFESSSSITVTAPNHNQLSASIDSHVNQTATCNSSTSSDTLTGTGPATITITPSSTRCSTNESSFSGGSAPRPLGINSSPATSSTPQTNTTTTTTVTNGPSSTGVLATAFTRDLYKGKRGEDVRQLQIFLNTHEFPLAVSGAGSPGNETTYFGILTRAALSKFQKANSISPTAGYFGPKTRTLIIGILSN